MLDIKAAAKHAIQSAALPGRYMTSPPVIRAIRRLRDDADVSLAVAKRAVLSELEQES